MGQHFFEKNTYLLFKKMKTSIIILTFNNLVLNKKCIDSILKNTEGDFEIIIVDNASSDDTVDYLRSLTDSRIKAIFNKKNLGFSKGNNIGAKEASGNILVFLNNDTEVKEGWLKPLLKQLQKERVGIVAPKMLYPDGKIQHAGVVVSGKHVPRHIYRRFGTDFKPTNKLREYKAVTGACLAIKKEIWVKVSGFDERYINGLEDVDLCFRVRELGYKVYFVPESIVIHHESISKDRFAHLFRNKELYLGRWGNIEPDEDKIYKKDGFGWFFILRQHIKNRYLTGSYREKMELVLRKVIHK